MFYANPSIKKARIGYRGAWAAFGVEFNFPVSHNWVSMSPVDFAFANHKDGSASIIVGNIDRVYGMQWTVELTLHSGSTVLEQRVTLSNRSDVRHRFYWWNNAAVEAWDDSRIEYPMRFAAAHGFAEVQKWPVDSTGKDLSVIRNQTDGPVSLFVHGSRENFMGVWHPQTNTGTAHFADYAELPAKKIWSWGVDAEGLDWRKALSDNNSAYVELQAGLFRNQETYAFLEPRQSIAFTEYWMPVRDTGGISRANLAGVVHLERKGGLLAVAFHANRKLPGAPLPSLNGNLVAALQTYQKALVKFPADFELLKAAGRLDTCLNRFEQAVSHLSAAHDRNTTDAEISYYLGIAYEGVERENDAADAYREAMRLPSYRAAAALRLAELEARRGALKEAKEFLTTSLGSEPNDLRAGEELPALSRALGKNVDGEKIANELLARFPLSGFLQEELGKADILHLASDPYRVLSVASEYARLGLYRRALEVLSRDYPSPEADQSEPGAVIPQQNPLVVYFRGYCREKLGSSVASDYLQ